MSNSDLPAISSSDGPLINWQYIWMMATRHYRLFLAVFIPVVGVTVAYLLVTKPLYESTAVVQVEQRIKTEIQVDPANNNADDLAGDDAVKTIEQNMQSYDLFEAVVKDPDIVNDPDFLVGYSGNKPPSPSDLADWLRGNTSIQLRHGTRLIDVTVYHRVPVTPLLRADGDAGAVAVAAPGGVGPFLLLLARRMEPMTGRPSAASASIGVSMVESMARTPRTAPRPRKVAMETPSRRMIVFLGLAGLVGNWGGVCSVMAVAAASWLTMASSFCLSRLLKRSFSVSTSFCNTWDRAWTYSISAVTRSPSGAFVKAGSRGVAPLLMGLATVFWNSSSNSWLSSDMSA
ncbi:MAG TPA: Wzz/FepE/Etk N-terminal domain-containing protein, partial [Candidatus Methylacidiphilales bacterium]|nr:Wzz/FepE/Etk N-terminal domain-containing protein [Candidatus Methylacidiphilales bacterium]